MVTLWGWLRNLFRNDIPPPPKAFALPGKWGPVGVLQHTRQASPVVELHCACSVCNRGRRCECCER